MTDEWDYTCDTHIHMSILICMRSIFPYVYVRSYAHVQYTTAPTSLISSQSILFKTISTTTTTTTISFVRPSCANKRPRLCHPLYLPPSYSPIPQSRTPINHPINLIFKPLPQHQQSCYALPPPKHPHSTGFLTSPAPTPSHPHPPPAHVPVAVTPPLLLEIVVVVIGEPANPVRSPRNPTPPTISIPTPPCHHHLYPSHKSMLT